MQVSETSLVGRTSADMRSCYLDWRLRPLARLAFREWAWARSVTVGFARAETHDGLRELFAVAPVGEPPWVEEPTAFRPTEAEAVGRRPLLELAGERGLGDECDDRGSLVVAFAACVDESGPRAWAIAGRAGEAAEPDVAVLGRVLRPEVEDRFAPRDGEVSTPALDVRLASHAPARARLLAAEPSPDVLLRRAERLATALHQVRAQPCERTEAVRRRLEDIFTRTRAIRSVIDSP